jgi:methylase of polypeptide subunit release factors
MPSQFVRVGPELLCWTGATGPFEYQLSPRVFLPSLTSEVIADTLGAVANADVVLDVGCGGGFLGILAARLGARHVYATDVSEDAVELSRLNAVRAGVADRITLLCGNGLEPFRQLGVRADVVINDISGAPDLVARRLGWYPDGGAGGGDGVALPIRIINGLPEVLRTDGGVLVQPIGSIQFTPAIRRRLEALFVTWRVAAYRQLFLPKGWASDDVEIEAMRRDGRMRLWEARGLTWWDLEILVCERLRRDS